MLQRLYGVAEPHQIGIGQPWWRAVVSTTPQFTVKYFTHDMREYIQRHLKDLREQWQLSLEHPPQDSFYAEIESWVIGDLKRHPPRMVLLNDYLLQIPAIHKSEAKADINRREDIVRALRLAIQRSEILHRAYMVTKYDHRDNPLQLPAAVSQFVRLEEVPDLIEEMEEEEIQIPHQPQHAFPSPKSRHRLQRAARSHRISRLGF